MNAKYYNICWFIVFMFICLQGYKIEQGILLDSKVKEYETHVKQAKDIDTITRRAGQYSVDHPDEFPMWKLIRREIMIEISRSKP